MSTEDTSQEPTQLHRAPAADIEDVRVENEMSQAYTDYAMSVIVGRALPDVRDGLKPVHRRILYAMHEEGVTAGGSHRKSANIVGAAMGDYHPHGDSAIYDALVRMAQPFSMRHPLVDGQGNFGSIDGDAAAAMRYTEARMEKLGGEMLRDLDEDTVEWQSNYDDRLEEPEVLPAAFPNLLVNGASGIAVGMSTNIPPHNLGEVVDALVHLIDNPDATVTDLMEFIKGPDFPTAAKIVGHDDIVQAYKTGRGRIRVRADYEKDEENNRIIITELPYQTNKSKLVEKIADVVNDDSDTLNGVSGLRDESDQNGVRIVVDLKRDALIDVVENQLIDNLLEKTFGVINLALVDGQPRVLTLKEMLQHYIDHRREVVTRRSQNQLDDAEHHAHILEGRLEAVENAEDIVELIQESEDRDAAITALEEEFDFSEEQATHVVRMQLGSLTSMEAGEIEEEYDETLEEIEWLETVLGDEDVLMQVIKDELTEIKDKYADERRTEIIQDDGEVTNEDLIPEEDIVVVMTEAGYLKRMPVEMFDAQSRGGKGVIGMNLRDGDAVDAVFTASTHDRFLAFTNYGNVYSLKGYEMPDQGRVARGTAAINILDLDDGEQLVSLLPEDDVDGDADDAYLATVTRDGRIKRTPMQEYSNIMSNGKRALGLYEGDELVDVELTDGDCDILISTRDGMSIRFDEDEVRSMGRTAKGVNGIDLQGDDEVVGMAVVPEDESCGLLTVTENGYGKRTGFQNYRVQSRYGKGLIDIKTDDRNGEVATALTACPEDDLIIMSEEGQIMRIETEDISEVGRNTKGVRVMSLDGDDTVVSVARVDAIRGDGDDE